MTSVDSWSAPGTWESAFLRRGQRNWKRTSETGESGRKTPTKANSVTHDSRSSSRNSPPTPRGRSRRSVARQTLTRRRCGHFPRPLAVAMSNCWPSPVSTAKLPPRIPARATISGWPNRTRRPGTSGGRRRCPRPARTGRSTRSNLLRRRKPRRPGTVPTCCGSPWAWPTTRRYRRNTECTSREPKVCRDWPTTVRRRSRPGPHRR